MEGGSCEDGETYFGGKLYDVVVRVLSCEERESYVPKEGRVFQGEGTVHTLSLERAQLIQGTEWKQCGWNSVKGHRKECGFFLFNKGSKIINNL